MRNISDTENAATTTTAKQCLIDTNQNEKGEEEESSKATTTPTDATTTAKYDALVNLTKAKEPNHETAVRRRPSMGTTNAIFRSGAHPSSSATTTQLESIDSSTIKWNNWKDVSPKCGIWKCFSPNLIMIEDDGDETIHTTRWLTMNPRFYGRYKK